VLDRKHAGVAHDDLEVARLGEAGLGALGVGDRVHLATEVDDDDAGALLGQVYGVGAARRAS
jgi:hypothetical protein